jgi:hypothetical protein
MNQGEPKMGNWVTYKSPKGEDCAINMDHVVNVVDAGKGSRLYTSLFQIGKDGKPARISITTNDPVEHFTGNANKVKRS